MRRTSPSPGSVRAPGAHREAVRIERSGSARVRRLSSLVAAPSPAPGTLREARLRAVCRRHGARSGDTSGARSGHAAGSPTVNQKAHAALASGRKAERRSGDGDGRAPAVVRGVLNRLAKRAPVSLLQDKLRACPNVAPRIAPHADRARIVDVSTSLTATDQGTNRAAVRAPSEREQCHAGAPGIERREARSAKRKEARRMLSYQVGKGEFIGAI